MFHFSEKHANKIERFFDSELVHIEGDCAGKPFVLEPWQRKIVRELFGWRRDSDGSRRYRYAYIEVPRKNGKSTFAAGIALFLLLCDGEQRPQVYSCAGDRAQASIVHKMARRMIEVGSQNLRQKTKLRQYRIEATANGGWYEATSAEAYTAHGRNPHGIVFDELHNQPTRELWDAMISGRGARRNPLVVAITTAGHDRSSICWEMHERALAAMADPESDPTLYPAIWAADEDDDWTSESVWAKANPNLGVSVSLEFLREECRNAIANPQAENTFRNLYLNQWTQQSVRWIQMSHWDACRRDFGPEDFLGQPAWVGVDLAATRDLNAIAICWERDGTYYVHCEHIMPEDPVDVRSRQDRLTIKNWADRGLIRTTPGNVSDYQVIWDRIAELCQRYDVRSIEYDPWGPGRIMGQQLERMGVDPGVLHEFPQQLRHFALPCKEFERRIVSGTFAHTGDPVLRWEAENVCAFRDASDNIRPDKSRSGSKIDGIVATIMALGSAVSSAANWSMYDQIAAEERLQEAQT
ncbi:MAG: terminase large subunit [Caulobacteraceae bacterium]|nr:terminase large subunit [Caulobacteraceae bacterium]